MSAKALIAAAALALCAATPTHAADLPPDLAKAVHAYDQAQIDGDAAALRRLLDDDYTLANSSGKLETKAQFIADSTAPGFKLDPFTVVTPIEKVWSDGAVMGGVATLTGTDGGQRFNATLRFADIWAKRGGTWRVIYTQVSKVPAA